MNTHIPLHKPRGSLTFPGAGSRDLLYAQGQGNWEGIEEARARTITPPEQTIRGLLSSLRERYAVALGTLHPGASVDPRKTHKRITNTRYLIQKALISEEAKSSFLTELGEIESDFQAIKKTRTK